MKQRCDLHCLTMMYKTRNGHAPNYLKDMFTLQNEINSFNTRGSRNNNFWVDKGIKSKILRNSFKFYGPTEFNKLPEHIKNCKTISTFKRHLIKFLKNN